MITLDPWPQLIYLHATGKMTVAQYVAFMAEQYKREVPAKLDETILYELEQLLRERLVAFAETPTALHPDHDGPKPPGKK